MEFADWLGRESRGRKIMFVAIGSASATGPQELNAKLAKKRSEALLGVDRPVPGQRAARVREAVRHRRLLQPEGGRPAQEHERYQHARLIAFFEKGQEPALPAEP